MELAGTGSRAIVAVLGPEEICGDMAFLELGKATAAVVAKDEEVEVDEIKAIDLRDIMEAFPRLASRFYRSLGLVLVQRLRVTTGELGSGNGARSDRRMEALLAPRSEIAGLLTSHIRRCSIMGTSLPFGADLNFMQSG